MYRRRPTKRQTGGPVPIAGPQDINVPMPVEANQPRLPEGDRQLLSALENQFGYSPDMMIMERSNQRLGREAPAGQVDRHVNHIRMRENTYDDPYRAETLGHELGHTLHRGTFDREYLDQIVNEEADRLGVSDKERQRILNMMNFDGGGGERSMTDYSNAPEEQFGRMAGRSMMRLTSDSPLFTERDLKDFPKEFIESQKAKTQFEDAVIGRMLNEAEEFGLGGFIKNNLGTIGSVAGGAIGSVIAPGVGTGIGAKLGGMAGNMGEQALADDPMQQTMGRRRPTKMPEATQGSYAYGGKMKQYAGGGKSIGIGQDAQEFVGPKHEDGGVPLNNNVEVEGGETMDNLSDGEYIFSDRLTIPKTVSRKHAGMTFAEYHKMLVEEGASPAEIQQLANVQEEVSGREQGPNNKQNNNPIRYAKRGNQMMGGGRKRPTMAYGGYKKKMQTGGLEDIDPVEVVGTVDNSVDFSGIGQDMVNQVNQSIPNMGDNQGFDATGFARKALPYLPAVMNLTRGLFESSDVPDVPYTPVGGRAEDTIRSMKTDVDVDPQLASVDRSLRGIMADPNASMNQKLAASAQAARQRAGIQNQAEMQENQLFNRRQQMLANAQQRRDRANAQMRTQTDQMERQQQMQADEAKKQLIQTGLQQGATTFQKQKAYEDAFKNDRMKFTAMINAMPGGPKAKNQMLRRLAQLYPEEAQRLRAMMVSESQTTE